MFTNLISYEQDINKTKRQLVAELEEMRQHLAELGKAEEKLRAMFESTAIGVAVTEYAGFNAFSSDKEIAKATGSTALLTTSSAGDNFNWGLEYSSQTDAWASGTAHDQHGYHNGNRCIS